MIGPLFCLFYFGVTLSIFEDVLAIISWRICCPPFTLLKMGWKQDGTEQEWTKTSVRFLKVPCSNF